VLGGLRLDAAAGQGLIYLIFDHAMKSAHEFRFGGVGVAFVEGGGHVGPEGGEEFLVVLHKAIVPRQG
jgi:hypothetical protein